MPRCTRSTALRSAPTDQLAYDVFEFATKDTLKGYEPQYLDVDQGSPAQPLLRASTPSIPTFASGTGGAPFKTVADYENALKRHAGYVILLDRAIGRFKEGETAACSKPR